MSTAKRQRKKQGRQARQEEIRAQQERARRKKRAMFGGATVAFIVVMAVLFSRGDSSKAKKVATKDTTTTTAPGATTTTGPADEKVSGAACPADDGSAERKIAFEGVPPTCIDGAKSYTARIETDAGAFTIALDAKKAPKTVNNFVFLARYHFYDGAPFHRVIPGFVVQGGDAAKGDGTGGPGYKFADELPKAGEYQVGSLAMANSGPNTNGSQFFVITGPQGVGLPPQYSLFAKVTDGLDVVKKIEADGADSGTPKVKHKMTKVTITES